MSWFLHVCVCDNALIVTHALTLNTYVQIIYINYKTLPFRKLRKVEACRSECIFSPMALALCQLTLVQDQSSLMTLYIFPQLHSLLSEIQLTSTKQAKVYFIAYMSMLLRYTSFGMSPCNFHIFQTEIAKNTIRVSELKAGVQSGLLNSGKFSEVHIYHGKLHIIIT